MDATISYIDFDSFGRKSNASNRKSYFAELWSEWFHFKWIRSRNVCQSNKKSLGVHRKFIGSRFVFILRNRKFLQRFEERISFFLIGNGCASKDPALLDLPPCICVWKQKEFPLEVLFLFFFWQDFVRTTWFGENKNFTSNMKLLQP